MENVILLFRIFSSAECSWKVMEGRKHELEGTCVQKKIKKKKEKKLSKNLNQTDNIHCWIV